MFSILRDSAAPALTMHSFWRSLPFPPPPSSLVCYLAVEACALSDQSALSVSCSSRALNFLSSAIKPPILNKSKKKTKTKKTLLALLTAFLCKEVCFFTVQNSLSQCPQQLIISASLSSQALGLWCKWDLKGALSVFSDPSWRLWEWQQAWLELVRLLIQTCRSSAACLLHFIVSRHFSTSAFIFPSNQRILECFALMATIFPFTWGFQDGWLFFPVLTSLSLLSLPPWLLSFSLLSVPSAVTQARLSDSVLS